jgi:hypothetical protein
MPWSEIRRGSGFAGSLCGSLKTRFFTMRNEGRAAGRDEGAHRRSPVFACASVGFRISLKQNKQA